MVNNTPSQMDAIFMALSDATRRGMIRRLSRGTATIGELGRPYRISKPAVTKHVKVLERAGLIRRERDGRLHRCTLNPGPMQEAEAWIERHRKFWEGRLDALARYVEDTHPSHGEAT
jgi:DNA-binding transcriptional ArsR family regulator